jgi:hypothetical protein
MNKKLLVSFDVSSISITSEQMALSFLHAFKVELKESIPKLESFRCADIVKMLTWLEFHYLNDLFLTKDEIYFLRYVHFNLYNLYRSGALTEVHFRVLQNDFTGLVTIRK